MHDVLPLKKSRWLAWLPPVALLLTSWILVTAMTLQARPGAEVVAVAFPPWWNARQVILAAAAANAAIVRSTALPAILVVRPDGDDGVARLRSAGAWLAFDPQAIAACFQNNIKDI